ncbi:MAG: hypothetical protein HKN21_14000, partial [Candidatus Eisenbacteria bacterium]|nr:hypothetical protein [Candidatus Eisenbacteria bacterium]
MFRIASCVLLLFVFASFSTSTVHATTLEPLSIEELSQRSSTIVHGTVVSTQAKWNEAKTMIFTHVQFEVADSFRGSAGSQVEFLVPGGVVDGIRMEIAGTGTFQKDQESILFLAPGGTGKLHVNGLTQGRFDVFEDDDGRKQIRGLALDAIQALSPGGVVASASADQQSVSLDEFKNGLRKL